MADKILIVDDEIETLRLVGLTLQRQGYQVVSANNGTQGLEMAYSEKPDLVIMDVMMPDIDGLDVTRRLRTDSKTASIPILMFSARAQLDDKVSGYEAGADDYLTKPIHPAELVSHVKNLLTRSKEQSNAQARNGYTIGILAAHGGLGASTLTLNLAISLQQKMGMEVIAAELRPGHGSWYADTAYPEGLIKLLRLKPEEITIPETESHLYRSPYGPRLLFSSKHTKDIELLRSNTQVEYIIQQLARSAPLVLLDIGVILWPNYEKLLNLCQEIILVCEPYPAAIQRTHLLVDELIDLGFHKAKPLTLISINRIHSDRALPISKIEEMLQIPVAHTISPAPEQAFYADEMKTPLIQTQPDGMVAQQYSQLAEAIAKHITFKMKDSDRILQRYRELIDISRDLASTLDLDTLLHRIISVAAELSDSEAASILLYDEVNKQLYFQAATNAKKDDLMLGIVIPQDSLAGWVAQNRQQVIVADVHQDKRWFAHVEKKVDFPTRSIIAIPMIAKDKLVGVLEALNKRSGTYSAEDEETLLVLGAQAAVAIENTRLFQQSDLIAELVHELRTPLSSIITVSYLLQRPQVNEGQRVSLAQTIHQEALRLNELATNFLDLARLESGRAYNQISSFEIAPLLKECCDIIRPRAAENGIDVHVETSSQIPRLEADRDKIKQVILNLVSNAAKYNRSNGKIIIKAQATHEEIRIAIQDTGQGLTPEDLSHLFERFFRSQSTEKSISGTGLGLSICKHIINSHGGTIEVESQLSVGSTFTIRLPIKR